MTENSETPSITKEDQPMSAYIVGVDLLFELKGDPEGGIPDALNALLTEQMQKYAGGHSALIDWRFQGSAPNPPFRQVSLPRGYEPDKHAFPSTTRDPMARPLTWTAADAKQIRGEGWDLFNAHGVYVIQRSHRIGGLSNDTAALSVVSEGLMNGSEVHRKAWLLHGTPVQEASSTRTYFFERFETQTCTARQDFAVTASSEDEARNLLNEDPNPYHVREGACEVEAIEPTSDFACVGSQEAAPSS